MNGKAKKLASVIAIKFLKKFFGDLYIVTLPVIAVSLDMSEQYVRISLSIFFFGVFLSQLFGGPLSDVIGKRRMLLFFLPIFIIGNLICAIYPSLTLLFLGIFLSGIGIGAAPAVGDAIVFDLSEHAKKFSYLLVIVSYIIVWAPAIGMAIGGILASLINWRLIFVFSALLAVAVNITVIIGLQESPPRKRDRVTFSSQMRQYRRFLQNKMVSFSLLAIGSLASGVIFYYSISIFIYKNSLHIALPVIGLLAFLIVAGNMLGKACNMALLKFCTLITIWRCGVFLAFLASCIMLLLAWIYQLNFYAILVPMFIYMIGLGMSMPAARAKLISLFPKQTSTISSLSVMSVSLCTVFSSFIAAHMHTDDALALSLFLVGLSLLSFWCVVRATRLIS